MRRGDRLGFAAGLALAVFAAGLALAILAAAVLAAAGLAVLLFRTGCAEEAATAPSGSDADDVDVEADGALKGEVVAVAAGAAVS